MPVLLYYSQKEAPSDAVIWRFLDLRKFRDLMANQELYFRRADLFDDQSEGLPPEQYVRRVLGLDPYDIKDQVALNDHLGSLAQSRQMYFISCWQLFQKEDLAIWEQYGHDGVAVASRYGLLKDSLASIPDETHIGLIQYGSAHLTDRFNAMEFITTKQEKYSAEREVRAILTSSNPLDGGNRHFDLNNFPHRVPLAENPQPSWVHDCKRRRISMRDLLQEVVMSPWAEPDDVEEIKLWTNIRLSLAPRNSDLRSDKTPMLKEYRDYHNIQKPKPQPERLATSQELEHHYHELMTLTLDRVRFLYRQRWERCRLETDGLPSRLDVQYLDTDLRVLKDLGAK
ncbi:MAG: hypothetical protein ACLQPN_23610 [Bryobacteraceae bacterium]